jgi:3'(2'), 5'-bisphosphate nucleotidase
MINIEEETVKISHQAGRAILEFYKDDIEVVEKENNSPLTQADLAAHNIILSGLKQITPDIPILSEEGGIEGYDVRKDWTTYWLVDPLDGTKEFIRKNGEFTVNIALIEENVPVFGVVHIPVKHITYTGQKGRGTFKMDSENKKTRIFSQKPNIKKPLTVVSSRSHGSDNLEESLSGCGVTVGKQITAGSSLKFCLVAEGIADIYPRMGPTMEWDTAAGDAVYRYSGKNGTRYSSIQYNKPDLRNSAFIIGLEEGVFFSG